MELPQLPLYQCHKKVRAAKIVCITGPDGFSDGHAEIVLDEPDPQYPTSGRVAVAVDADWINRNPKLAVGGYFVHYCEDANQYTSYSPADTFEGGYMLAPVTFKDRVRAEKAELDDKLSKLAAFINNSNSPFRSLPNDERQRLRDQAVAMARYSGTLGERIAAFPEVQA